MPKCVIPVQHSHRRSGILHGADVVCHIDADVVLSIPLLWLTNGTHIKKNSLFFSFCPFLFFFFSLCIIQFYILFRRTSGDGVRSSGAPSELPTEHSCLGASGRRLGGRGVLGLGGNVTAHAMARLLSTRLPRRCLLACGRCAVHVTPRDRGKRRETEKREDGKKRKEGPTCQLV